MDIAVVGTGFIGGTLGRALARSGHRVTFGSRNPDNDQVSEDTGAAVSSPAEAVAGADAVILAIPGNAVKEFADQNAGALEGKLVIDATNRMGSPVANARADLPGGLRYARAFNTVGGENMADPVFADGPADMFFSAPAADRAAMEEVISGVGLRPVYVGEDQEEIIDALFRLWIALAMGQGRGRRLALRLLEG
jgi:8-hydroxy-5-deazaflavin:NADPH oxidoreductase